MRVVDLKALGRERGLRGYSRLRKVELIALLQNDLQPPRTSAPRTRPPRPTRPPPPPQAQSVRFRPDRRRQPELMKRLEGISTPQLRSSAPRPPPRQAPRPHPKRDTEFKPYQLKPKRDTNVEPFLEPPIVEPPIEQPSPDPKKLKRMKKKLDELNRKIRHSRKKHDGMIHKRNSLRKAIEGLKDGTKPEPCQNLSGILKSKLLEGLTEAIGLMEDQRWTLIHSLVELGEN